MRSGGLIRLINEWFILAKQIQIALDNYIRRSARRADWPEHVGGAKAHLRGHHRITVRVAKAALDVLRRANAPVGDQRNAYFSFDALYHLPVGCADTLSFLVLGAAMHRQHARASEFDLLGVGYRGLKVRKKANFDLTTDQDDEKWKNSMRFK